MNKNTGFTLIEVLIAVLVLAVGLLGLAGLQATSLKNTQSAYNRSQATELAYDMADRIRANIVEANKLAASPYITISPTAAAAQSDCKAVSTTCTTADMAQNDLFEWNTNVTVLPGGAGTIAVVAATRTFTITISWTENRDDNNDGVSDVTSFQTRFQL